MKLKLNKKTIIAIGIVILVIALLFVAFTLLKKWEAKRGSVAGLYEDDDDKGLVYLDGKSYMPKDGLEAVLLIGVDKYEAQAQENAYNNNQQADFLMLLILDKKNESYTELHINRDTMSEIPVIGVRGEAAGSILGQLALSHTYGSGGVDSCRNTVKAVSNFLYGIKIDHYIALTMDAVAKINDSVGGVTVTVLDDMTSISPELKEGAELTLTGDLALAYVRTRYGLEDSSNLRRMERQRQYMSAFNIKLAEKMATEDAFDSKLLNTVSESMTSDCTLNQLGKIYERIMDYEYAGVFSAAGEAKKGAEFMEFYADDAQLKALIAELFYIPVEE